MSHIRRGSGGEKQLVPSISQDLEFLNDRRFVECFAIRVIEAFGEECVSIVFLPWAHGPPPAGVLCPTPSGHLDPRQLQRSLQGKSIVVATCTFKFKEEETAAEKIVSQLEQEDVLIFGVHLFEPDRLPDREHAERVVDVFQRILATHVHDVLMNPAMEKDALRLQLKIMRHSWGANCRRLQHIMNKEPQPPSAEEIQSMEDSHQNLLWTEIPREILPHFREINKELLETDEAIGDYRLVKKISSESGRGIVWEARDQDGESVALKFIEKLARSSPHDVECINREFRFLNSFIRHPHISRALDFLHSQSHIYLVLEFAGEQNLAQRLEDLPGKHLSASDSCMCFRQIASAVVHCHENEITHRNISLEHVVLKNGREGEIHATLVDFYNAMVAKPGVTSFAICSQLPCMAPEMLLGEPYSPMTADCWSAGVVLLEMSGGKGTLHAVVSITDTDIENLSVGENYRNVAERIRTHFHTAGSHEHALAFKNGVQSSDISGILMVLLRDPGQRSALYTLFAAPE